MTPIVGAPVMAESALLADLARAAAEQKSQLIADYVAPGFRLNRFAV